MRNAMLLLLLLLGMSAWSQDEGITAEAPVAEDVSSEVPAAGEAAEQETPDEDADDADLDDQSYERDDDIFVPTEEIPVDESIPFPTDI
ncbi:MAG: hypothetical protein WDZ50_00450 [Woeseia sp.]